MEEEKLATVKLFWMEFTSTTNSELRLPTSDTELKKLKPSPYSDSKRLVCTLTSTESLRFDMSPSGLQPMTK